MTSLKPISAAKLKFDHVVATGGIGSGMFFLMEGNHTLGRNESRPATILPCQDFCKQHIILHYLSVLLGPESFQSFALGKVGSDDIGETLLRRMKSVGINTNSVSVDENTSTLFSVCFQYPDHTGGNISTASSASNEVTATEIDRFFRDFNFRAETEIILAAPEVPVPARIKLLAHGRIRGSFNVACLSSSEVDQFGLMRGFEMVDILFVNIDEAATIGKIKNKVANSSDIVSGCVEVLKKINPEISIIITDGVNGSYCYTDGVLEQVPPLLVPVKSTAGAGDALLAGTVAGLCCGLSLTKGAKDRYFSETPLQSAVELGTLLAALSVTSADTIHLEADVASLHEFALKVKVKFSQQFLKIF